MQIGNTVLSPASSFAIILAVALAFTGCMKSGEDATGLQIDSAPVLDASHGGARIVLPEIDPAALAKAGKDSTLPDTTAQAWFELTITGENMPALAYRFPLTAKGSPAFEIKGIPAGNRRSFHGSLLNANRVLTHEGTTLADIHGGAYTDVRLYLAKAGGSANICVVIEGQKPPACAVDTSTPPPNPWPVPDSGAVGGCWWLSSPWITGNVKLYGTQVNGSMGILVRDSGRALDFTTWSRHGDTLAAILVAPNLQEKWLFSGLILSSGLIWSGTVTNYATGKTVSFTGKTLPCGIVVDTGKVPVDTLPVPPKPDSGTAKSIPMPGSGAKETTLCFEMRFDYGTNACELQGYAKMDFLNGKILFGNMSVADRPGRDYWKTMGQYDSSTIGFYGVTSEATGGVFDTLSLKGYIGVGATMAKGDYVRLPSGKKGNWTMHTVTCGSWTPVYPDSSCSAKGK
jgi:hypothetical protein